jgi:LPXTG-site transpeptidase (sortase) family protein
MSKIRVKWDKLSKPAARVSIVILVFWVLIGLLIFPKLASSAHTLDSPGVDPQASIIKNPADSGIGQVVTPTITSTITPTLVTPTNTATITPTITITPTVTITPTATATKTFTPSPTNTAGPSPTVTGTLQPNAVVTISVTGSPAQVNQNLVFTIKVTNIGTGPTRNNVLSDSFDTYLDVLTVTTTQGTVLKQTHTYNVSIGDVTPASIITVVATVRVNSTLNRTITTTNTTLLTYYDALNNAVQKTAGVSYQVVFQTLPSTGELPLNWRESSISPTTMIPGAVLILAGGILLILVVFWSKARNHPSKVWMTVGGAILFLVGFVVAITASGSFNTNRLVQVYERTPTSDGTFIEAQAAGLSATILPHLPASAFSTPDSVIPIVTLPDYPVPTPVITITPKPGEAGPDTSEVTRIVIPILNLDTVVKYVPYDGFTWLINGLRQEVAWMGDTSWPGLGSNTGLAGHVTVAGMGDGPFRHLDELPMGELVLVYTERNIYTYQVRESRVTDDEDMSVTLPTDNPQISLITCVNWDQELSTYVNRLVVIADLIDTTPLTMSSLP